jgi:hypothetical protein
MEGEELFNGINRMTTVKDKQQQVADVLGGVTPPHAACSAALSHQNSSKQVIRCEKLSQYYTDMMYNG